MEVRPKWDKQTKETLIVLGSGFCSFALYGLSDFYLPSFAKIINPLTLVWGMYVPYYLTVERQSTPLKRWLFEMVILSLLAIGIGLLSDAFLKIK